MDSAFLLAAFVLGFMAQRVRLPPLVGYLAAGFALHGFGYEATAAIEEISKLGVLVLLFAIGLKLKLSTLALPVVWAGASLHMAATTATFGSLFLVLGWVGVPLVAGLGVTEAALAGFAFSFSSTVFAVKALGERNESTSLQGRIAIGILVVQDIFAVIFLTFAVDASPSLWAIPVVLGVIGAQPLYGWLLDRGGRGELQLLLGLTLAIAVGAEAFDQVGLKPDLGALIVGVGLAKHPRAGELADTLLGFKDILLIGFFLSIGLGGTPDGAALAIAAIVVLLLPFKTIGFLWLVSLFRFRVRTAWHTSSTLATFSEFGLIVAVVGVERELLDQRWTSAIAVAVSASFALASPLNSMRFELYRQISGRLTPLQRLPIQADDALIEPTGARVLVFGMGRVGAATYDGLVAEQGPIVIGVDRRDVTVEQNVDAGRNAMRGDALDSEFWQRLQLHAEIDIVVLAMSDHEANLEAIRQVRSFRPDVAILATALFADESVELGRAGADEVRNLYDEVGQGLTDDALGLLQRMDDRRGGSEPSQ